jgi:hypothetical protein
MTTDQSHWEQIYQQVPLIGVPQHYAGMRQSPFTMQYLQAILERCPRGGRTLETGFGSGYGVVFLSLRGVSAEGIDNAPANIERARQVNTVIGGNRSFRYGDLFDLYRKDAPRYDVIHHQGVMEHFTLPQIRAALAQQAALAVSIVFSVPSVNYPFPGEFGDERLLPLEVWQEILAPFDIEELRYYGDPQHGEKEHVLCVLRGQRVTPELLEMMTAHTRPYPTGITGLVLARNELVVDADENRISLHPTSQKRSCLSFRFAHYAARRETGSLGEGANARFVRTPNAIQPSPQPSPKRSCLSFRFAHYAARREPGWRAEDWRFWRASKRMT